MGQYADRFPSKREATSFEEACNLRTLRVHRAYFPASCQNPCDRPDIGWALLTTQAIQSHQKGMPAEFKAAAWYEATRIDLARAGQLALLGTGIQYFSRHDHHHHLPKLRFAARVGGVGAVGADRNRQINVSQQRDWALKCRELSGSSRTDLGDTAEKLQALMRVQLGRRAEAKLLIANDNPLKRTFEDFKADAWIDHFLEVRKLYESD